MKLIKTIITTTTFAFFTTTAFAMAVVLLSPLKASAEDGSHGFVYSCMHDAIEAQEVEDAEGLGVVCVTRRGVRAWFNVRNLVPGDAYTLWWVYFDDPMQCLVSGECAGGDFRGDNPLSVFGRMDSSIGPHSGKLRLSGRIGGFTPSNGAQIWLWLFGHGPADTESGRHLARQLLTPELPAAGAPHLGNVDDGTLGFPAAVAKFYIP